MLCYSIIFWSQDKYRFPFQTHTLQTWICNYTLETIYKSLSTLGPSSHLILELKMIRFLDYSFLR